MPVYRHVYYGVYRLYWRRAPGRHVFMKPMRFMNKAVHRLNVYRLQATHDRQDDGQAKSLFRNTFGHLSTIFLSNSKRKEIETRKRNTRATVDTVDTPNPRGDAA